MNRLKSWQQKQHTANIKYHPSWLIASIAAVLAPCYVLLTSIESHADANRIGKIVSLGGQITVTMDGKDYSSHESDLRTLVLREFRETVLVAGGNGSWVNMDIGGDEATGGPDPEPFSYSFPCIVSNKWTIKLGIGCQGILLKQSATSYSQLSRTKQKKVGAKFIRILRSSDQPTVIQTDESKDGSQLTVDVLAGKVTIRSRLNQEGISLSKGQRYTYSVNSQKESIGGYDPDWDTVRNIFLNPNNWEPSDANQIEAYNNAITPPPTITPRTPPPTTTPPG